MAVLRIDPLYPNQRQIDFAVAALKRGGLIVYPTDTTYGLGADLFSKKAIEKIYGLKPHKKDKPLTFICSDLKDISRYARVSDYAYRVMKKLVPGPFTFILEATREVPKLMMTKRKTVGIRVPDNLICQKIASALGNPIISTSAMSIQREYIDDPVIIEEKMGHAVDYILDCGILSFEPSTVLDFTGDDSMTILRQGKGDVSMML